MIYHRKSNKHDPTAESLSDSEKIKLDQSEWSVFIKNTTQFLAEREKEKILWLQNQMY